MAFPKPKAAKMPRRMPRNLRKAIGPHAKAVGELVWTYNQAHSGLAMLFSLLANKDDLAIGQAAWLSLPSDHAQRRALVAILEVLKIKSPITVRVRNNLIWATKKIDKLAETRNDAVHMSSLFGSVATRRYGIGVVVNEALTPRARAERLKKTHDMNKTFRIASADLWHLTSYVFLHYVCLSHSGLPFALPHRPRLKFPQGKRLVRA